LFLKIIKINSTGKSFNDEITIIIMEDKYFKAIILRKKSLNLFSNTFQSLKTGPKKNFLYINIHRRDNINTIATNSLSEMVGSKII